MQNLVANTRRINDLLQRTAGQPVNYDELAQRLSDVISASVYISDQGGKLLGHAFAGAGGCPAVEAALAAGEWPADFNRNLQRAEQSVAMLPAAERLAGMQDEVVAVVPVYAAGSRLGTLVLGRRSGSFTDEELVLAELAGTVAGLDLVRSQSEEAEAEARRLAAVQVAVSTLSYSELEAVQHIFDELDGREGLVVASKIADRVGITRSVIVNALRKFESAGVIESRSLGMKGTHIRVLNEHLLDELKRRRT